MAELSSVVLDVKPAESFVSFYEIVADSLAQVCKFLLENYTDLSIGSDLSIAFVYDNPLVSSTTPSLLVIDVGPLQNSSVSFPEMAGRDIRYQLGTHTFLLSGSAVLHVVSNNELFSHRLASALFSLFLVSFPAFHQFNFLEFRPDAISTTTLLPDETGTIGSARYDVMINLSFMYELDLDLYTKFNTLSKISLKTGLESGHFESVTVTGGV